MACKAIHGRIQDRPAEWYGTFHMVISGLDNIEARRWLSAQLVALADPALGEDADTIPLIDGGTEGFKGQVRVFVPRATPCFECLLYLFPPQETYPLCTIRSTPRLPEHCIEWASILHWPAERPGETVDGDNPDHVEWLYNAATARAKEYGIEGVTMQLTQGVIKNIIPAIASTNAIVAAQCCTEAFKIATQLAPELRNSMRFNALYGLFAPTETYQRNPDCPVCGTERRSLTVPRVKLLEDFLADLAEHPSYQLKEPSVRTATDATLYMRTPPALERQTAPNLKRQLGALLQSDGASPSTLLITDPSLPGKHIEVDVTLQD